jgi:Rv0078B-related antitoxin
MFASTESGENPLEEVETDTKNGMAIAFELLELALLMRGERHRREFPEATDEEIACVVQAWKIERPGAPYGDAVGISVPWPRK